MEIFFVRFWWMLVGHALADYPLQSEAMAREKDRHSTTPLQASVPWFYWLTAHALLHGGAVGLVTQSIWLGLAETNDTPAGSRSVTWTLVAASGPASVSVTV